MLISSIKAILARLILSLHAFVTVWRTTVSEKNSIYWLFLIILVGVFVDLAFVLIKRKGREWKWFSPSIFFYLGSTIPCVWLLELRRLDNKRQIANGNATQATPGLFVTVDALTDQLRQHLQLKDEEWVSFVEQAMLLVIIFARWLLPVSKEQISRDQLSQLLLVYLGLAADIIELFAIFDEPAVLEHSIYIIVILAFWSWSLMQFTLVLTATRSRGYSASRVDPESRKRRSRGISACFFCDGEIWSILIMCSMLDLPFLSLRLTAMIHYKINTYTIYFFTCKNIMVVLLQAYRLSVVCAKQYKEQYGRAKVNSEPMPTPKEPSEVRCGNEIEEMQAI